MGKFVLFLFIALMVGLYIPRSRAVIVDTVSPVLQPVFRWQTNSEMEKIARDLISSGTTAGSIPTTQQEFETWLGLEYVGEDSGRDSWGNTYQLRMAQDSFTIVSPGKDGQAGTPDDLSHKARRPWQTQGR